jgi:hypothetical protein
MVLRDWLPSVIQSLEPYVSSEDIDKGTRWSSDIAKELDNSAYGILCVTQDNLAAPWINFEAGALSKSVDKRHPVFNELRRQWVRAVTLGEVKDDMIPRAIVTEIIGRLKDPIEYILSRYGHRPSPRSRAISAALDDREDV